MSKLLCRTKQALRRWGAGAVIVGALSVPSPASLAAQQPSQAAIQAALQQAGGSDAVRAQIQQSGLTPDQIRARLRASGYSGTLLDPYLGNGPTSGSTAEITSEQAEAMAALGIIPDTTAIKPGERTETTYRMHRPSNVFGVDVFRRNTTQFQPMATGPVPPDYRLGPGDKLVLILTGAVELTHQLAVTREGFVLIPQVGQVYLAGLTLEQAKALLYDRLGRVYSGVRRGANASIAFELSVANVRALQVYVVGEVEQPGAYQVSALGTPLTALYAAGGVTERANLRKVEVRSGARPASTVDLYDYLLHGDMSKASRLADGDVVFVGVRERRVSVNGKVNRPASYDVIPGETLSELVASAGGFAPDAALKRITIHRFVPVATRGPERLARSAVDVPLAAGVIPTIGLEDGDSVVVDSLPSLGTSYFVVITGMVTKPGQFPWHEGMTLRELVLLARGPQIGADMREAEIAQLPADRTTGQLATTIRVPLDSTYLYQRDSLGRYVGAAGVPFPVSGTAPEVKLSPFDNVLIFRQPDFELQRIVTIRGEVRFPGTYALRSRNERLSDLITHAGGLTTRAYPEGVQFIRMVDSIGRVNVDLPSALRSPESRDNIFLQPGDSVVVPEFQPSVKVVGAVNSPGSVLWLPGKDLGYYIGAAGGLTENGNRDRASVRQANGEIKTHRGGFLFFGGSDPKPTAGATVMVPTNLTKEFHDRTGFYVAMASVIASTATIFIALKR
jgi:protein involved in polysaccharide export with SLBB domain